MTCMGDWEVQSVFGRLGIMLQNKKRVSASSRGSLGDEHLRVNVSKGRRNRGHSPKFDFAHTFYIGRPKSHTYEKDVH